MLKYIVFTCDTFAVNASQMSYQKCVFVSNIVSDRLK